MSSEVNTTELLLQISADVSSIKTDMANFKEAQKIEKETFTKEIEDNRVECNRRIDDLSDKFDIKISGLQSSQKTLSEDVDMLKRKDEQRDAKRWRTVVTFICTAIGGMVVAKLPDIFKVVMKL